MTSWQILRYYTPTIAGPVIQQSLLVLLSIDNNHQINLLQWFNPFVNEYHSHTRHHICINITKQFLQNHQDAEAHTLPISTSISKATFIMGAFSSRTISIRVESPVSIKGIVQLLPQLSNETIHPMYIHHNSD